MRVATAAPPTWPQPLAYPGAPVVLRVRPVRLGQGVEFAGAAVSAARTGQGFATGAYGFETTGQALSTTGAIVGTTGALVGVGIALMATAPIPVVGWVAAAVGALLTIAGMFMGGKPQRSHAQREALEVQRTVGTVGSMITQIQAAPSLDALWTVLKSWQSGYVGGTSSVAVPIYFRPPFDVVAPPGGAEGLTKALIQPLVTAGDILLPPEYGTDFTRFFTERQGAAGLTATWPGNQNPQYMVWTEAGFYKYFVQHPDELEANTQAGVTRSMLVPINTAVRNALLNQLKRLGVLFPPGSGAAQLFGIAAPAPSGPDPAMVGTWVTQAYQQLLGRAPSSIERAAAVTALTAQQVTPEQFLTTLTSSAEFQAAQGTTVGVTPTGAVVITGAPLPPGPGPSTYWTQGQPILAASMLPIGGGSAVGTWIGQHPSWTLGLTALGAGLLLFVARPTRRRR